MEEFHSKNDPQAHSKFVKWIQGNPQGYVINDRERGIVLHQATCSQFLPYEGVDSSQAFEGLFAR